MGALIFYLLILVGIMFTFFPRLCLKRRSSVIPKENIRTVRIIGIIILIVVVIGIFLMQLLSSI